MAGKGYGADATLVAAAYRLGQSYVPGDYSKIFEKQYEGLIAANQAKAQAKIDFLKDVDKNIDDLMKSKKEEKDWLEEETSWFDEYEKAVTDHVDGKINDVSGHYENGGTLNEAFGDSDEDYLRPLKEDYESLKGKIGLNKEQRKTKAKLRKEIENFRGKYNSSKANLGTSGIQWRDGFVNKEQSFKGEPELQMLFGQIYDPKSNFEELGIKVYWEKGERFFEYTDGRGGAEVKSTSENPGQYDFIPESSKKKNIISEKDLLSRLKPKDTKAENDHNAIDTQAMEQISKMTTNKIGVKVYSTEDFATIGDKVQRQHYDVAMLSTNPNDIYTRSILIGNTSRVYYDDLQSNRIIDRAIIEQIGIGSEVFTEEELNSGGGIDPTELAAHAGAKAQIIETLTNPKTSSQKEIAATEYSKYRKDMLKNVFNAERKRLSGAKKPKGNTTYTTTTLFGNTVPIASTVEERTEYATVNNIAGEKPMVQVNNEMWKYNKKTEKYTLTKVHADDVRELTREELISEAGEIYGNISSDYFTTGMNTILTNEDGEQVAYKGKKLRIKDVEKKDKAWYIKSTGAKLNKKYYDQLNKIYIPK
jgi:hypothetical protein